MAGEAEQDSIGELFTRLAHDARDAAIAEVDLIKVRASTTIGRYRGAAIYFAAAGVLALAALIALLIGLIMTLTPHVGPGFATLIVIGTVAVLAGVLALIGRGRLSTGATA
jgi:hypothetical protein